MKHDSKQEAHALRDAGAGIFVARLLERPVDEHGPSNDVLVGNKAPVAAVEADVAIVAHGEDAVGRNHKFAILDVGGQGIAPFRRGAVIVGGGNGWEVVTVSAVGSVADDERGIEFLAIAIDHAVNQLDAIARHSHYALHDVEAGLRRRNKHKNVIVLGVAIGNQRANPIRLGSQVDAIHKDVVANQQGILHGTGGDDEGLQRKSNDEESGHQNDRDRSNKLRSRFFGLRGLVDDFD